MKNKLFHYFIIGTFVSLYILVATISMINSVEFFDISHNRIMSWVLALGFELGAAASLAAILILDKTNKVMVWGLFILLTSFQMMANSYHAYVNLENYIPWIELFGLTEEDLITQKRILSIISGAILPVVALGFIKSLTDYIKPNEMLTLKNVDSSEEENLFNLPEKEIEKSMLNIYDNNVALERLQFDIYDNDIELEEASFKDLERFYEEESDNSLDVHKEDINTNVGLNTVIVKDTPLKDEIVSANSRDNFKKKIEDKKEQKTKVQTSQSKKTDSGPLKRQIRSSITGYSEPYKP